MFVMDVHDVLGVAKGITLCVVWRGRVNGKLKPQQLLPLVICGWRQTAMTHLRTGHWYRYREMCSIS